jgi:bifunctional DNase/RNase
MSAEIAFMIEVFVSGLAFDTLSNAPVVLLKERDGERVLPIWIGPNEAGVIALELSGMNYKRPLTHDLIRSILRGFNAELQRVVVSSIEENTFYAKIYIRASEHEIIEIDARPSDSIAIALKMSAPIFVSDDLDDSLIRLAEGNEEGGGDAESLEEYPDAPPETNMAQELRRRLRNIKPEDFGNYNL